jgi:hypothetical protein
MQLESGRLFIAADHYAGKGVDWGSHSMYSDDLGKSWRISASIDGAGGSECQAARAQNGSLLMNMRKLPSCLCMHNILTPIQNFLPLPNTKKTQGLKAMFDSSRGQMMMAERGRLQ